MAEEKTLFINVDDVMHYIARENNLSLVDACLLAIISKYEKKKGAKASDQKYAEILLTSVSTIRRSLDILEEKKLIIRTYFDDKKRNRGIIKTNLASYSTDYQNDHREERLSKCTSTIVKLDIDDSQNEHIKILNNNLNNNISINRNLDESNQDISSGRFALKNYKFIYLHNHELEKIVELYKEQKLTKDEVQTAFMSCNNKLETMQGQVRARASAFSYLTGFILENILKTKRASTQLSEAEIRNSRAKQVLNAPIGKEKVSNLQKTLNNLGFNTTKLIEEL